jgi:hypothetical protein
LPPLLLCPFCKRSALIFLFAEKINAALSLNILRQVVSNRSCAVLIDDSSNQKRPNNLFQKLKLSSFWCKLMRRIQKAQKLNRAFHSNVNEWWDLLQPQSIIYKLKAPFLCRL